MSRLVECSGGAHPCGRPPVGNVEAGRVRKRGGRPQGCAPTVILRTTAIVLPEIISVPGKADWRMANLGLDFWLTRWNWDPSIVIGAALIVGFYLYAIG